MEPIQKKLLLEEEQHQQTPEDDLSSEKLACKCRPLDRSWCGERLKGSCHAWPRTSLMSEPVGGKKEEAIGAEKDGLMPL